jgi:4-amino-4-deoxy-L-arabinose transferase-like glycosyltransferase
MPPSASPPRFGRPQIYALLLLAAFAAQCLWMAAVRPLDAEERWYIDRGLRILSSRQPRHEILADNEHSPLVYLIAAAPLHFMGGLLPQEESTQKWLLRLPFLFFGLLRGASLWYVARRLYGNRGGYMALSLYCFSPRMVAEGSRIWPDALAAWGFFGAIFTAIAMSHTLYALPGTLPWPRRWRRTILMGIGLGLGAAAQYSVVLAIPLALIFVLYLVPGRRAEALAMLALAGAIAAAILLAVFWFSPSTLANGMRHALVTSPNLQFYRRYQVLAEVFRHTNIALLVMLGISFVTWLVWRQARYFGNTAPLIVMVAIPLLAPVHPGDEPFRLWIPSIVFAFMFIAGIFADLLETWRSQMVMVLGLLLLAADIGLSLRWLTR